MLHFYEVGDSGSFFAFRDGGSLAPIHGSSDAFILTYRTQLSAANAARPSLCAIARTCGPTYLRSYDEESVPALPFVSRYGGSLAPIRGSFDAFILTYRTLFLAASAARTNT